ncbi:hypothetical protein QM716_16940 [Rhodococcus sp. IEGM 1409]|nr:hypothetical protein [Rhodococcus sp. IEGM 1409]MDI9901545.1 hypothetical protein [Rhodococcus sp. IEGM 1409]
MTDPVAYVETVSGGRGIAQMEEANRNFVSLPAALDARLSGDGIPIWLP